MNSKIDPPPFTLANLSPYAIYHLKAACLENPWDETFELEDERRIANKKKSEDDAKFSLFQELPIEIQAKIWKYFVHDRARIVQLGSFRNEPNILRQLNRQIKEDCLSLHGFADLDQSKQKQEPTLNTVFHPQIDLVHLGPNSPWIWGPRSSTRRFAACGVLDKIRCVAIMHPKTNIAAEVQFESLREYENLEMVFIVIRVSVRTSTQGWKKREWLRFRVMDDENAAMLVHQRWFNPRSYKSITQEYRERIQGIMARGSQRVAPRIVFVEEVRAWQEELPPWVLNLGFENIA